MTKSNTICQYCW